MDDILMICEWSQQRTHKQKEQEDSFQSHWQTKAPEMKLETLQ
jgi:hypothetical protein